MTHQYEFYHYETLSYISSYYTLLYTVIIIIILLLT